MKPSSSMYRTSKPISSAWPASITRGWPLRFRVATALPRPSISTSVPPLSPDPSRQLPGRYFQHGKGQAYDRGRSWVAQGDCGRVLADLPDRCADLIFADPPYFLQLQNELRRPNNTVVEGVDDDWDQ